MNSNLPQRTLGTGLLAAGTLLTVFLAVQVPLVGGILLAVAGMPALFVGLAWGAVWFSLYGILILGISGALGGVGLSLMLATLLVLPAGFLAWTLHSRLPSVSAVGLALVLAFGCSSIFWSVAPVFGESGAKLWQLRGQFQQVGRVLEGQLRTVYEKQQVEPATADFLLGQYREWIDYIALLIPMTFLFGWHGMTLLLLFWVAWRYGRRWGLEIEPPEAFSKWRIDWNFIWFFLAGWLLFNGAETFAPLGLESFSRVMGANFLAISKAVYFVLGFSLVFYYFEVYKISPPSRLGLSLIATFFYQAPMWLGIADVWLDLRAPKQPKPVSRSEEEDEDDLF